MGRAFAGEILTLGQAWAQTPAALDLVVRNLTWPGILLAGIGLAGLAWSRRWSALALTGLIALVQLAFNLFYGIGDIYVLYVPIYLIAALWAGVGLAVLATALQAWRLPRLLARLPKSNWRIATRHEISKISEVLCSSVVPALGLALPLALGILFFPLVDRSQDEGARAFWDRVLSEELPTSAMLVSNDRDEMTPLIYLQQVEGRRPGLTGLFPLMVARSGWLNVGEVTASALATGRPVYLVKAMPGLEVRFDLRPQGTVVEVMGSVAAPAGEPLGAIGDAVALQGVEIKPPADQLRPGQTLEVTLYWRPLRPLGADYTSFVHLLDGAGNKIAQHDASPGGVYYPTSLWHPGETLRDRHVLSLPATVPAGPYSLRVGLYSGPDLKPLGEPLTIDIDRS
jgi:hypothetical protein